MARYVGPSCRICRREGRKLFLKGTRCDTVKCALMRREYAPGMHPWRRGKMTDYAVHLREKQKLRRFYGVLERQFRRYFRMAEKEKGNTGENLLRILERRLDNVLVKLGWALSRSQARQMISHGRIRVNGRRVDVSSYIVRPGDRILPYNEKTLKAAQASRELVRDREVPAWLEMSEEPFEGRVLRLPAREEISLPIAERVVVEFASR